MTGHARRHIHWIDAPAIVLFVVLAVVVLLQFITRYVLNDSLAWTEEAARFLLIVTAFAGSITALRKGEHIFLELTYRVAARANVKPLALMADGIGVVYLAGLAFLAVRLTMEADRRMISIDLPISIVYGFVAITLLVGTAIAVGQFARRSGQTSEEILADIEAAAAGEESM